MQQPPAKGGSKLLYILLGCFGCAVLSVIGVFVVIGLGVAAVVKQTEPQRLDAKAFLSQAGSGDIDGAHAHFADALKAKKPKEALKAEVEKFPDLFTVTDSTFNNVSVVNDITMIKGTVTSKNGKNYGALFRYKEEGGKPKIVEYILRDGPIADNE